METLTIAPATTLEIWGQKVAKLFEKAHGLNRLIDSIAWKIGDELIAGEKQFQGDALREAVRVTGKSESTLWNFKRVALNFPRSRRVASLSWSHHKEVADYAVGAEQQDRALTQAVQRKLPVKRLRAVLQRKDNEVEKREKDKLIGTVRYAKVPITEETAKTLKSLANAQDKRPERILAEIVSKYFTDNRREITEKIEVWATTLREAKSEARQSRKVEKAQLEGLRAQRKRFNDYFLELRNKTGQPAPEFLKAYLDKRCGHARWLEIPPAVFEEVIAKIEEAGEDPQSRVRQLKLLSKSDPPRIVPERM